MGGGREGWRAFWAAAWLVVALALAGPAGAEEWYEAYQDGMRALARGQGSKAAALFDRAIRKRPEPGLNVPTYGTNVEERYFPYLRLAEASLLAGDAEAAGRALARSEALGKEPADERARLGARVAAAVERSKPPPATTPPTLPPPAVPTTVAPAPVSTPTALPPSAALPTPPAPSVIVRPGKPPPPAPSRPERESPPPPSQAAVGSLEVFSVPAGALVYLDDEFLGRTDPGSGRLVKGALPPGRHRLRLSLADHADLVQELEVRAGSVSSFRGALSREDARGRWPWLAIGAGLLAVLLLAGWALAGRRAAPVEPSPEARTSTRAPTPRSRPTPPTPHTPRSRAQATPPGLERTPDPEDDEPVPFGEYMLLSRLGRGGMAAVYKAERGGEVCALKRPLADHLEDPQFLERFLREAEIGRTLYHPNIVRILDRGEADNVPYFTMELIDGETLHARLRREGAMDPRTASRLVSQVAEALDYAHNKGVVHRDLKPSNIMVLPDGLAKVMDYGIARARRFAGLTTTGAFLGTPDYVAPEIIEGSGSDARSDLYSLGIVFYEMVTGRVPFVADTPFGVLRKHCTEEPGRPSSLQGDVPPEVDAMILRLLRKDPGERFGAAEELLVALQAFLAR